MRWYQTGTVGEYGIYTRQDGVFKVQREHPKPDDGGYPYLGAALTMKGLEVRDVQLFDEPIEVKP